MKVVKEGIMPDGTKIQIEDWNENYDFIPYSSTLATYAKSKMTVDGSFAPKAGEISRFQFNFKNNEEADSAFDLLISGDKTLADFKDMIDNIKHKDCI